jgi:hypothetical protein
MAITAAKKARIKGKLGHAARVEFVTKNSSFKNAFSPFFDANWDPRARSYIETGNKDDLIGTPLENRTDAP